MIAYFQKSGIRIYLAGGNGITSETSGLRLAPVVPYYREPFAGSTEAGQWQQAGAITTVTFQSVRTFSSVANCESYILGLPASLITDPLYDASAPFVVLGTEATTGTKQVETATCSGTASGSGTVTATVASAILATSQAVTVLVSNLDTPSVYADLIRAGLASNATISARYTVGGTGADIALTAIVDAANDTALNIAITRTAAGTVAVPTSANTTAGTAPTYSPGLTLYNASANVTASQTGASAHLDVEVSGTLSP